MATYRIWLVDAPGRTIESKSVRHRVDAAAREALRVIDAVSEASGAVHQRQHHVAAHAVRNWSGKGEVVALIDGRHEIHLFRG